jgi:transcriptional regulator with XRE-family HTH domain
MLGTLDGGKIMARREHFAAKLRRKRREAGMSLAELGARVGLSRQAVSQFEAGDSTPSWPTVQLLAMVLKCSVADLTDDFLELPDVEYTRRGPGRPRKDPQK